MAYAVVKNTDNFEVTSEENSNQYVTFQVADEVFGFPMLSVLEIVRLPNTIRVPLTPSALVGLSNLRGCVLPILDLRQVLQLDKTDYNDTTRVVVSNAGSPVGLVVDKVAKVINVEPDQIDYSGQMQSSIDADMLGGVIKSRDGEPLTQILNVEALISHDFSSVLAATSIDVPKSDTNAQQMLAPTQIDDDDIDQLVSFVIEGQEYAFNLMEVEEIVRIPERISKVPHANNHILGLIDLRERLLPLVSMRRLFALSDAQIDEDNRILVVNLPRADGGCNSVGLVVDDVTEVLQVTKESQDIVPTLLSQSDGGSAIDSICQLDNGNRLVSILRVDSLFTHPVIQAAMEVSKAEEENNVIEDKNLQDGEDSDDDDDNTAQLVVFYLGGQEYGVSIDDVQEITRVPEKLDKVPKTAEFIEGMVNLRGTVLPVLDMRSRFDMERMARNERQRIIVLSLDGKHTGFMVDSVAEVLRLPREQIEAAPNLSENQARIMGQVINLKESERMIQVLAVRELLNEQEMLAISEGGDE